MTNKTTSTIKQNEPDEGQTINYLKTLSVYTANLLTGPFPKGYGNFLKIYI